MTKTYTWTTPKGAKVEMTVTVNHLTRETVNADGNLIEVACDRWTRRVDTCKVNGKPTQLKELREREDAVYVIIARSGRQEMGAQLPGDVEESIYGEERAAIEAKLNAAIKAENEYEAQRVMVLNAMGGQA